MLVEGNLNNLKLSTLRFKPPQRYIPERRYYASQKGGNFDDSKSTFSGMGQDHLANFDTLSEMSLTHGFRESQFGFSHMPDLPAFKPGKRIFDA